ncbi:MAG: hypothetical protein QME68_08715 [Elusimicrobiota bacterium]|nr:hypothetical protein [Elusimicrobiota bacterium]
MAFGIKAENISTDFGFVLYELGTLYNFSVGYAFGMTKKDFIEIEKAKLVTKHFTSAMRYFQSGEYLKAQEEISQALILNPEDNESKELKSKILAELDRVEQERKLQEAKECLDKALEFFDNNKIDLAKENLSKCRNLNPELIRHREETLFLNAKQLVEDTRCQDAQKVLLQVLFLNPQNLEAEKLQQKVKEILEFFK